MAGMADDLENIILESLKAEKLGNEHIEALRLDEERRRMCNCVADDIARAKELLAQGKTDEIGAVLDKCYNRLKRK